MTIDGGARIAGVIGWPIHHSLSPVLHNHWLTQSGINGAYIPMAVRPDQLEPALRALPMLGLRGTNVTVPHKETAMRVMDSLSPLAERIGAVNTVTVAEDGALHGDNTDAFGFIENLKRGAPDLVFEGTETLVIGSGGAARAVVAALLQEEVGAIHLANRTPARAEALARDIGGPIHPAGLGDAESIAGRAALVVNTTSLGMSGSGGDVLIQVTDAMAPEAVATDIVYTPLITPFLERARSRGIHTVDGLGMLIHQARPGFKAWYDRDAPVSDEDRTLLLSRLEVE